MASLRWGRFRAFSVQNKMLLIILPLIAIPMLTLAVIGFITSSREAAKTSTRYLNQRENDLRVLAENLAIRDYFKNRFYGLTEEAEVHRRELERSFKRFADRSNRIEPIYVQIRYVDAEGQERVKIVHGSVSDDLGSVSNAPFFKAIQPDGTTQVYRSPIAATMTYAIPVHEVEQEQSLATFQGAVILDAIYPLDDFQRTTSVIARTFLIITLISLSIALCLIVNRVSRLTGPIRRLSEAAHQIAEGRRGVIVEPETADEVGRLASAFNEMAASLDAHEMALQRKVTEMTTLYEVGQEISAQVDLEPTLDLIVERARTLLQADVAMLAMRQEDGETFVNQAYSGSLTKAIAQAQIGPGRGLGGRVIDTGEPLRVDDYQRDYADSPFVDIVREAGLRAWVGVPLKARYTVIGVLYAISRTPQQFTTDDQQLLSALAGQAAIAIENARLYGQVRRYATELEVRVKARTQELQETNLKLEEASRHKSEFLASMSHELRTPLNAIIGYSEILQEESEELGHTGFIPDLKKIQTSGLHLLALINDILDLAKIEAGRMELFLETFDVATALDDIVTTVDPLLEKNANAFTMQKTLDLGSMRTDLTKLRQILFNLLSNACKFTERGTITLTTTREADAGRDWLTFQVADTGIGMTTEQMQKVFEAFAQAEVLTARQYGGTGLGLTITRRFCEMMEGDIIVDSEAGKGSVFTVRLPAELSSSVSSQPFYAETPVSHDTSNEEETVLVIDDDPAVRDLMQRFLAKEGVYVATATSGTEGLLLAKALHPTLITLDVLMPDMDGWSVLAELKADPEMAEIPVMILSIVDDTAKGFTLGAAEYLTKPIDWNRLATLLHKYRCIHPPCQVLLVEDDANMRREIRTLLERQGWAVNEAPNGRVALQCMAELQPDLILLDLIMPEVDGFAFIDAMQQEAAWRTIPIVVVTGMHLSPEDNQRLNGYVEQILRKGATSRETLLRQVRDLVAAHAGQNAS